MDFYNERTKDLQQGLIRAMFDKAAPLTGVISMGIGEPDMPTPAPVCQAGKEALDKGITHYTPNAGLVALRQAIAEQSSVKNVGYHPTEEIIVTNGGMGALSLLMAVILNPQDEVIIQDPQWLNYVAQVTYYGGVPVRVPTSGQQHFVMQPAEIEKRVTPRTKAILINSPNNPTGFVVPQSVLEQIAEIAKKHDLLVITDEVYNTLLYSGEPYKSIAELPGMKERTVVINSFSKAYAMTGWRIGYAAGPASIIKRMTICQENFNSCANAPGQYAAIYALRHPELSEELRGVFADRRRVLLDGLRQIKGFSFEEPDGAFYVFPSIAAFGMSDLAFCERLLEEQRVVCIPGSAFGACGAGHIRMAYTVNEDLLRQALERIEKFCSSLG